MTHSFVTFTKYSHAHTPLATNNICLSPFVSLASFAQVFFLKLFFFLLSSYYHHRVCQAFFHLFTSISFLIFTFHTASHVLQFPFFFPCFLSRLFFGLYFMLCSKIIIYFHHYFLINIVRNDFIIFLWRSKPRQRTTYFFLVKKKQPTLQKCLTMCHFQRIIIIFFHLTIYR